MLASGVLLYIIVGLVIVTLLMSTLQALELDTGGELIVMALFWPIVLLAVLVNILDKLYFKMKLAMGSGNKQPEWPKLDNVGDEEENK